MNLKKSKDILKYVVQKEFFPKYAPGVKCWIFKSRGKDARGLPQEFSDEEMQLIIAGINKMTAELTAKYGQNQNKCVVEKKQTSGIRVARVAKSAS